MGYRPWGYKESDMTKHTHIHSKVNDINLGCLKPFPHSFYFFVCFLIFVYLFGCPGLSYSMWDL